VYGTGKNVLDNPRHVAGHREACVRRLAATKIDRVVAVGIRPVSQDDDPIVWDLIERLASDAATKTYVSPSADECDAFGGRGFVPVQQTLADFVSK
jgi:hypothetical protein